MRRVWWLLFGVVLAAGGAAVAWQAARQATGVEAELAASRDLLSRAGSLAATPPSARLTLVDLAGAHVWAAQARLDRWPLRQVGAVPLLGRDVRVARAVTGTSAGIVQATAGVATALEPLQTRPPTQATIGRASVALLALHRTLDEGAARVRTAEPLLAGRNPRSRFLAETERAARATFAAGQGLRLAAALYGPAGSTRYFLAFQNPAELRGTGGLIGQYGILESSPQGPHLTGVESYTALERRTRAGIPLPAEVARRYGRFAVGRVWSSVNIPPDLPTVGHLVLGLYRRATGTRIDGMIAVDPLALAEILRVSGPVTVDGVSLNAGNVASVTLVDAYLRYARDNQARRAFLEKVAEGAFAGFQRVLGTRPVELIGALATATRGRHLQVYSGDPAVERALLDLGAGGSAAAPRTGDYLMPLAINTGGNKLDAFLHRTVRYRVRLEPDGSARASASIDLRNEVPARGLPRYVVGPYDKRFRAGNNYQFQALYVAGAYGFVRATRDGRPVGAEAQAELGGMALSQAVVVPPGRSVTLAYDLERRDAVQVTGGRASYQLLVRPQATVYPDLLEVSVEAPRGWQLASVPPGFRRRGSGASWSGVLDRTWTFSFVLARAN